MPAIANIAIADGKTTPVTHTFQPQTTNGALAKLINRASAAIIEGQEQLWIEYQAPLTSNAGHRYTVKMVRPVVQAVNGVDQVAYKSTTNLSFNFSQRSTNAERKDDVTLLSNLLQNATFRSAVENLEPYY